MEIDARMKEAVADRRKKELEETEKIFVKAKSCLESKYENLKTLIKFGDPTAEILSAAEQLQADMIVVGRGGLKGGKRVLGRVSRNIAIHARTSVLIGKAS